MASNTLTAPRIGRPRLSDRVAYDVDALVDAAVRLFSELGYDGTSMDDIAQAAGLTKGALYHHVSGKQELLDRALTRALNALFAVLDEPESNQASAIERVEHVLRRTVTILVDQQLAVGILLREKSPAALLSSKERRREFERRVSSVMQLAVREGSIRADIPPALLTKLCFGAIASIAEWYRPGGKLSQQQLSATLNRFLLDGIAGSGTGGKKVS